MKSKQIVNLLRLTPLAIAMGVLVTGCDSATPSTESRVHPDRVHPVKAFTVAETPQIDERSYPLVTRASHLSELAFRRSGEVIELPVTEGRRVKKGELLARLDPSDHERRLSKRLAELQLAFFYPATFGYRQLDHFTAAAKRQLG